MEVRFYLSGSLLFSTETDTVPSIGSVVRFRTESYKKGLHAGSLISVPIGAESPPEFDYSKSAGVVVHFDANRYTVIEEGPAPPE